MLKYYLFFILAILVSCNQTQAPIPENKIPTSPFEVNPIKNGEEFPVMSLKSANGDLIDIDSLISTQPTIFVYFRGGWCYYCNLHFDQIHTVEDSLMGLGYRLVMVSSDLPEKMTPGMKQYANKMLILSDSESKLAKELGIAYALEKSVYQDLIDLGINLEETQGNTEHLLPVPAVFYVDKLGIINFQYVNPNHKIRLHPKVMLCAAEAYLNYNIDADS